MSPPEFAGELARLTSVAEKVTVSGATGMGSAAPTPIGSFMVGPDGTG